MTIRHTRGIANMVGPLGVAVGAVVGAGVLKEVFGGPANHDTVLKRTINNVESKLPSDANLYADHIDGYENPRQVANDLGLTHVPDAVVRAGSASNLMLEVETDAALDDNGNEAKDQLKAFATPGYKNVLVVPDTGTEAVSAFESQLNSQLNTRIYVETPRTVASLL